MTLLLALLLTLTQDADRIQDLIRKLGSEDYACLLYTSDAADD